MKIVVKSVFLSFLLMYGIAFSIDHTGFDLSEKIIQIKKELLFPFEDQGFGFYDWSDGRLKIFNWNFDIKQAIPITIGEGPGEIKPFIFNACLSKDKIFLNGYLQKYINVYDRKGSYIKRLSTGISPRAIIYRHNKLYLFNATFFNRVHAPVFVKILDPATGNTIKDIRLKKRIGSTNALGNDSFLTQRLFRFDVDHNNNLYLLDISASILYQISQDGELLAETKLPYKSNMDYGVKKEGSKTLVSLSMYDFYNDVKVIDDIPYACFFKTKNYDRKTNQVEIQTFLVKLSGNRKYLCELFDGELKILGAHNGMLYLFNFEDYQVIGIKLSDWN